MKRARDRRLITWLGFTLAWFVMMIPLRSQCQQTETDITSETTLFTSLEEALKTPDLVHNLALRKMKLDSIPDAVFSFHNLRKLDMGRNRISKISPRISELTQLTELNMEKNELTELPGEIGALAHLKVLNVNRNSLETLPAQIGDLTELEVLDLWSNEISTFPEELAQLKNLKVLDLRVIIVSDEDQQTLKEMLPDTKIHFSPNCNCKM
ncbi:MAG: leucine-rich repeat domain-containing protein [Flavobacteriales bacterium]|nr:leucine-rich repeat domain-containing protein [Flavobacteriales bacterium]